MNKSDIIRKLTSRKLWLAVALFVSGLIVAFGGAKETAETVSGCIMQGAAALAYILAEGLTDAVSARSVVAVPVLDGIDVDDLTDAQLRSVLQQMGFGYTEDMTREQLLEALDEAAE